LPLPQREVIERTYPDVKRRAPDRGQSSEFFIRIISGSDLSTSLRANGSRERAPDDRLREAIQRHEERAGLLPPSLFKLRRTRSSQELLAMTG
jgi:hypothetical protein